MKILKATDMLKSRLSSKIKVSQQEDYLVIELKEALTDTEFTELQNFIIKKVMKSSIAGVVLNLKKLSVIDSFATKIFQDIAHLIEQPLCLVGMKKEVAEVMEKQGLHLSDGLIEKNKNITEAVSR